MLLLFFNSRINRDYCCCLLSFHPHVNEIARDLCRAVALTTVKGTSKEQQLSTYIKLFFHISLPSSHDYDMKLPNFTFCGGREHMTTTLFSFSEL